MPIFTYLFIAIVDKRKHIKALPIKDFCGYHPKPGLLEFAKKPNYFIVPDKTITGDAPKDFIRLYRYGTCRKANPKSWPLFIAKLGDKHYPIESIIEFLMNRLGDVFGFNMAKSHLAWFGGQIRFLSEYFLSNPNEQILEHGADLYAGFLNDRDFVEEIERQNQSPNFFTIQFTQETFLHFFPNDHEALMLELFKLLVFDALVGNSDRHFYNWGIIRDLTNKTRPVFSPIYDTARGLFWNDHEDKIQKIFSDINRRDGYIKKYSDNSKPKIGWDGANRLNHFDLLIKLRSLPSFVNCNNLGIVCSDLTLGKAVTMITHEFSGLLSPQRIELIVRCLRYRHERIKEILNFAT